ncbi:hypothetical protein X798_05490 [Onchocerca flexuosa]|uniref:Uncharacterized protein n=1 Tax=Onchocerca flexuosa TaxID=387005 RepID=A0A238BRK7_9BILA|nr:hypothetical protein X798_05490 [Onchocerca flexuosa]
MMSFYDSIDNDSLMNYANYSITELLYCALKESVTSKQSCRTTAIDSAGKNVDETIDKTTKWFSRIRQQCFACFNLLKIRKFKNEGAKKYLKIHHKEDN